MKKKQVIIIGAGPAGLTAGLELIKSGYNVIILEEEGQVGGISKTINYKGNHMDLGGHRFFSKEKKVLDFWTSILPIQGEMSYDDKILNRYKELSIGGPNPEKEDKVMLLRNRVSRIYYLEKFFDYPVSLKLQTFTNMGMVRTIKSGFSYLKSLVIKREENSLEAFYINRFGKQLYGMFFEGYTEKLWGRHPKLISPDWGSQRVKGLSILAVLKDSVKRTFKIENKEKETSLIEEFMYPKYGPGQLWEEVAHKFESLGGKILLNSKVIKINCTKYNIDSISYISNGKEKEIKGDLFISSMPLKDLVNNFKGIRVPKEIKNISSGLPYRDFVTIGLLVDKLKLKNKTNIKTINNIIPDCWIYIQQSDVKIGRIQIFNNWSPYMVKDVDNTVWIGLEHFCNEGDSYWKMSDSRRVALAISELIKMNIIESKDNILDYHVEKVKKAYPAYFDTYKDIDSLIEYLNLFDNLYCIGRNGQHRYNNMDHSMMTAFNAADNIVNNIKDKANIWNVNVEKDYHENSRSTK